MLYAQLLSLFAILLILGSVFFYKFFNKQIKETERQRALLRAFNRAKEGAHAERS
jgi:hypothetical protein